MSRGFLIAFIIMLIIADIILLICSHLSSKDEYNLDKECTKYEKKD